MPFFISLISFLVTISVLVIVHEFGHFWVAKKFKVKVLRFSIGFGKVLKSWQLGETKYTLCALPFGGFVKMLEESDEAYELEKNRAFDRQNVYKRIAIVMAGPLANFIFAVIVYTFIFIIGITGIKPIVGVIDKDSAAQLSGLQTGDQILEINEQKTHTISEFYTNFIQSLENNPIRLKVITKDANTNFLNLYIDTDFLKNPEQSIEKYLGFKFAIPKLKATIDKVIANSPASKAGLLKQDSILKANDKDINSWSSFVDIIKANPDKKIKLKIEREHKIMWTELTPKNENGIGKAGISVLLTDSYFNDWQVSVKNNLLDSFLLANSKVYQLIKLNFIVIKNIILGEISLKHMTGPIGIADYAGKTAQAGFITFLSFLAIISIGLGVVNLLPIPLLDGGHLFFYFIEILKGNPVKQKFKQIALKLGFLFIIFITIITLYNDFSRLLF